jgi:ribosomal protein S18 acetylase RimI-like enzyme
MPDEPAVHVRRADLSDANDVAAYLAQLDAYARDPMGAGRPLPGSVRDRLPGDLTNRPGSYALLAEAQGQAVGFATCFLGYSTFQARPLLNVHDIAVLPAWRGRGIARQLLDATADLARSLDCCRVTLEVRGDNPRARRIYDRAGFVPADCSLFMEKVL